MFHNCIAQMSGVSRTPGSLIRSPQGLFAVVFLFYLSATVVQAARVAMNDFVLFGRVFDRSGTTQFLETLPGQITVKLHGATGPNDTVLASTAELVKVPGALSKEFYVLRINRFDSGTPRKVGDTFVLPGERIHIYIGTEEVLETEVPSLTVTTAVQDVRLLHLNFPANLADSDNDGLPDAWEQTYFSDLGQNASDDANEDGVSNHLAFALGLDPTGYQASQMPFFSTDVSGAIIFYFRQSASATNLAYFIEGSPSLQSSTWSTVPGVTPEYLGTDGYSRLYRAVIPTSPSQSRQFFRLSTRP